LLQENVKIMKLKKTQDGVAFRTVGWFKACVIFVKVMFAVGVLSLPACMYSLGAVGGSLSIVVWGVFNTYTFLILGEFREKHPGCHFIADMVNVVGGVAKEITGVLSIFAYVLCAGAGIIGVATWSQRSFTSRGLYSLVGIYCNHRCCTCCFCNNGTQMPYDAVGLTSEAH
jgi:hypothetical protein